MLWFDHKITMASVMLYQWHSDTSCSFNKTTRAVIVQIAWGISLQCQNQMSITKILKTSRPLVQLKNPMWISIPCFETLRNATMWFIFLPFIVTPLGVWQVLVFVVCVEMTQWSVTFKYKSTDMFQRVGNLGSENPSAIFRESFFPHLSQKKRQALCSL